MDYPQQHIKPYDEEGKKDRASGTYVRQHRTCLRQAEPYLIFRYRPQLAPKSYCLVTPFSTAANDGCSDRYRGFAILACRKLQPAELIGTDISEGMMNVGREKVKKEGLSDKISFAREDCTSLSFADNDFDAITVAFGIRNFEDLDKGLSEMCRVLKPGGHLVILELTTPDRFPMKQLFSIYSKVVIPLLGKLLSKDNSAYRYLPTPSKYFLKGKS